MSRRLRPPSSLRVRRRAAPKSAAGSETRISSVRPVGLTSATRKPRGRSSSGVSSEGRIEPRPGSLAFAVSSSTGRLRPGPPARRCWRFGLMRPPFLTSKRRASASGPRAAASVPAAASAVPAASVPAVANVASRPAAPSASGTAAAAVSATGAVAAAVSATGVAAAAVVSAAGVAAAPRPSGRATGIAVISEPLAIGVSSASAPLPRPDMNSLALPASLYEPYILAAVETAFDRSPCSPPPNLPAFAAVLSSYLFFSSGMPRPIPIGV